jgi:hypothetical protein
MPSTRRHVTHEVGQNIGCGCSTSIGRLLLARFVKLPMFQEAAALLQSGGVKRRAFEKAESQCQSFMVIDGNC